LSVQWQGQWEVGDQETVKTGTDILQFALARDSLLSVMCFALLDERRQESFAVGPCHRCALAAACQNDKLNHSSIISPCRTQLAYIPCYFCYCTKSYAASVVR